MPILAQVPEYADAGLWYAAPADVEEGEGFFSYSAPVSGSYCAQYADIGGTVYAVFRMVEGNTVPSSAVPVSQVISGAFAQGSIPDDLKFFARIGGK